MKINNDEDLLAAIEKVYQLQDQIDELEEKLLPIAEEITRYEEG